MKKSILLAGAACILFSVSLRAQCSSCTTTITGTDAANHWITSGTTLCIAPGGTATGLILIQGGTLCNQGTINNHNLEVLGSGSVLNNYGTLSSDSLLVTKAGAVFNNYGLVTNKRLAVTASAVINNYSGTITCDFFGDSMATCTNNGNLTVNMDFGNGYSATFTNNNYLKIGRDFNNGFSATFYTACMVSVMRDWYNSATVSGPASSCGGFNIAGASYNSGTVGGAGQHTDICDAGHPAGGVDGNTGTLTGVTFCTCSNACTTVATGIAVHEMASTDLIQALYPNPASDQITLVTGPASQDILLLRVTDVLGKQVIRIPAGATGAHATIRIPLSDLVPGVYFLTLSNEAGEKSIRKIQVIR